MVDCASSLKLLGLLDMFGLVELLAFLGVLGLLQWLGFFTMIRLKVIDWFARNLREPKGIGGHFIRVSQSLKFCTKKYKSRRTSGRSCDLSFD